MTEFSPEVQEALDRLGVQDELRQKRRRKAVVVSLCAVAAILVLSGVTFEALEATLEDVQSFRTTDRVRIVLGGLLLFLLHLIDETVQWSQDLNWSLLLGVSLIGVVLLPGLLAVKREIAETTRVVKGVNGTICELKKAIEEAVEEIKERIEQGESDEEDEDESESPRR
jgi:hypothetical protein